MSESQEPTQLGEEDQMERWRRQAIEQQTFYCDMLSDRLWERYTDDKRDIIHLKNKIGYALLGYPKKRLFEDRPDGECQEEVKGKKMKESFPRSNCADKENSKHVEGNVEERTRLLLSLMLYTESIDSTKSHNLVSDDTKLLTILDTKQNSQSIPDFISFFNLEKPLDIILTTHSDDGCFQDDYSSDHHLFSNTSQDFSKNPNHEFEMYYSDEYQIKLIDFIIKRIKFCCNDNNCNEIYIAFIFVIAKLDTNIAEIPIIRVRHTGSNMKEESCFVDPTGRCYKCWNDFLEDNSFPNCVYCYPKNGFYTPDSNGEAMIEFALSPETGFTRKFNKTDSNFDITNALVKTAASLALGCAAATLAVPLAPLIPISAPLLVGSVVAGSSMADYVLPFAGKMSNQNHESAFNRESTFNGESLFNHESKGPWITMSAGILGATSMGALRYNKYMARNHRIIGKAASLLVNGVEIGKAGLSVSHQGYKIYENRSITLLDGAELDVSLLFFYNSAIRLKTVRTILSEVAFRKLAKFRADGTRGEGNACVIKTVTNLEIPQSYFKQLNRLWKSAKRNFVFTERSCEFQIKMNLKIASEFQSDGKKLFSSLKANDVKNFNTFFSVIKNDDSYSRVKLSLTDKIKNLKDSNPLELINMIFIICRRIPEAKELYHKLMEFYEDNLRHTFEKLAEDIADIIERKLCETCNEQNENCKTLKKVFFRAIDENDFSSWDYFEYCIQKLKWEVNDKNSVIIVPQKVGWLFLCDDPRVHSVFVAVVRVSDDVEKITCIAMMKNRLY